MSKSLKQTIYDTLRLDIQRDIIPVNTRILETELADAYHVSRTPMRSAIGTLTQMGYLENIPGHGIYVTLPLLKDMREYYRLHIAAQELLLKHILPQVTPALLSHLYSLANEIDLLLAQGELEHPEIARCCQEIHDQINHCTSLPYTLEIVDMLPHYWDFVCINRYLDPAIRRHSFQAHRGFVDALSARDPELLLRRFREHYAECSQNRFRAYDAWRATLAGTIAGKTHGAVECAGFQPHNQEEMPSSI